MASLIQMPRRISPTLHTINLYCARSTSTRPWLLISRFYSIETKKKCDEKSQNDETKSRFNSVNIQMLSEGLHDQIFKTSPKEENQCKDMSEIFKHLQSFKISPKDKKSTIDDVNFELPKLFGRNIDEHFREIAERETQPYRQLANSLVSVTNLPPRPKKWVFRSGWTCYDPKSKTQQAVSCPDDDALIFDVEVLVPEGNRPTLATAVSPKAWYSWCSEHLVNEKSGNEEQRDEYSAAELDDLIPVETSSSSQRPRLVIGHNVGFDRSYIRDQYKLKLGGLRFLDTMSMHIACCGMTSMQRILYVANKKGSRRKEVVEHEERLRTLHSIPLDDWIMRTSLNNLGALYTHYFPGRAPLTKSKRDVFVEGTMADIRTDFQDLMWYCSSDVVATHNIYQKIWPLFMQRFPHPVTLAGMLEMGTTYLPVNNNWQQYINQSEATYDDLQAELKQLLGHLADEACQYMHDERYKDDVWLWDLDWSTPKIKKTKKTKVSADSPTLQSVLTRSRSLASRQPHMPGYPRWYSALCPRDQDLQSEQRGPSKLSTQMRVTPKLLRLVWDGFPLHYSSRHGWGVLVPRITASCEEQELDRQEQELLEGDEQVTEEPQFPINALLEVVKQTKPEWVEQQLEVSAVSVDEALDRMHMSTGEEEGREMAAHWEAAGYQPKTNHKPKKSSGLTEHIGDERFTDVVPGVDFYRLPHKDGKGKNVGNPLSKDFLTKIEEGVLRSASADQASTVLRISQMCSYWKNNKKRVRSQMVVELDKSLLPPHITSCSGYQEGAALGAILPRVVTAGTITRRAVEPTWLTASNAYADRIGSELKAMIHSPPGYHFVGADVDSQELWIAALLGDAHFAGVHGCTALGWMLLQGNKREGTDMHSMTASLVGISRDQAKVFNYGRIYGAGVRFAQRLLMQFNHRLSQDEARTKAAAMYAKTKGKRSRPRRTMTDSDDDEQGPVQEATWRGGSESHMFNKLESIARSPAPSTPVLGCRISQALEPKNVDTGFMPSRINWVVQSSAVDYLHLLLVCMRWLATSYNIDMRLSISIHDELRYLVSSRDRYRAALALQISNLLTRAMFSYHLGMEDLPQSVAFFSAVDVDVCLRKEPHLDCVTPSNPHGLHTGYGIAPGEALDIHQLLDLTGGCLVEDPAR